MTVSLVQLKTIRGYRIIYLRNLRNEMFFVIVLISCTVGVLLAADNGKYTTKYDNVDIDAVIRSERLTNNYVGCLLETRPCTPDAAELKRNLPDALETDCSGCSTKQKEAADKISHHLIDEKPEDWKLLEAKYDPTGAYRARYLEGQSENAANKEGQ